MQVPPSPSNTYRSGPKGGVGVAKQVNVQSFELE